MFGSFQIRNNWDFMPPLHTESFCFCVKYPKIYQVSCLERELEHTTIHSHILTSLEFLLQAQDIWHQCKGVKYFFLCLWAPSLLQKYHFRPHFRVTTVTQGGKKQVHSIPPKSLGFSQGQLTPFQFWCLLKKKKKQPIFTTQNPDLLDCNLNLFAKS